MNTLVNTTREWKLPGFIPSGDEMVLYHSLGFRQTRPATATDPIVRGVGIVWVFPVGNRNYGGNSILQGTRALSPMVEALALGAS